MKKIPITAKNKIFAKAKPNFTHDHSGVKVGSIMYNIYGEARSVTKIDIDECGRRRFWNHTYLLGVQYNEHHNMTTKPPFYAHEFIIE